MASPAQASTAMTGTRGWRGTGDGVVSAEGGAAEYWGTGTVGCSGGATGNVGVGISS